MNWEDAQTRCASYGPGAHGVAILDNEDQQAVNEYLYSVARLYKTHLLMLSNTISVVSSQDHVPREP